MFKSFIDNIWSILLVSFLVIGSIFTVIQVKKSVDYEAEEYCKAYSIHNFVDTKMENGKCYVVIEDMQIDLNMYNKALKEVSDDKCN